MTSTFHKSMSKVRLTFEKVNNKEDGINSKVCIQVASKYTSNNTGADLEGARGVSFEPSFSLILTAYQSKAVRVQFRSSEHRC